MGPVGAWSKMTEELHDRESLLFSDEHLRQVFERVDADADGLINEAELREAVIAAQLPNVEGPFPNQIFKTTCFPNF